VKKILLSLLLYCACGLHVQAATAVGAKVIFFDVGQGNCTFVHIPAKGKPPLLVDAGSSSLRDEGDNFKEGQIKLIQQQIGSLIPRNGYINIIISHGDLDHYSWIQNIFPKNREKRKSIFWKEVKLKVLCGGRKEDYPDSFQHGFLADDEIQYVDSLGGRDSDSAEVKANQYFGWDNSPNFKILTALTTSDKNKNSIIVKCSWKKKSVLITGDATGDTVSGISSFDAQSTILQLSHHGATSDMSNSSTWIKDVSPSYIVSSSGTRQDYPHPDWLALNNIAKAISIDNLPLVNAHLIRFHVKYKDYLKLEPMKPLYSGGLHPFLFFDSNYLLFLTHFGIYNTTDAGNITFSWDAGDVIITQGRAQETAEINDLLIRILGNAQPWSYRFPHQECLSIRLPPINADQILGTDLFNWNGIYELDVQSVVFQTRQENLLLPLILKLHKLRRLTGLPGLDLPDEIFNAFGARGLQ